MQPNTQNAQNQPKPASGPVVNGSAQPQVEAGPTREELAAKLEAVTKQLAALQSKKREVKSNPNTIYRFDRKRVLPASVKTQQVIALAKIIGEFPVDQMTEPELFAALDAAHAAGKLVTNQPPASIFRYYKLSLQAAGIVS